MVQAGGAISSLKEIIAKGIFLGQLGFGQGLVIIVSHDQGGVVGPGGVLVHLAAVGLLYHGIVVMGNRPEHWPGWHRDFHLNPIGFWIRQTPDQYRWRQEMSRKDCRSSGSPDK